MAEGRSLFDLSDDDDDTKTVGPTSITASTDQLVSTDRPEDGADGFSDDDSEEFAAAAAEIMQGEEGGGNLIVDSLSYCNFLKTCFQSDLYTQMLYYK